MQYARSVLVVHNVAHQGRGPMADLANLEVPPQYREHFRLDDPIGGEHMNIMKAAFLTAHRLVAVSHGYSLMAHRCCSVHVLPGPCRLCAIVQSCHLLAAAAIGQAAEIVAARDMLLGAQFSFPLGVTYVLSACSG